MSSYEGSWGLSWDAMRSTFAIFRGARAASTATIMKEQKIWNPLHGIVFAQNSSPPNQSMSTAASADLMFHSNAEDQYVRANIQVDSIVHVESGAAIPNIVTEAPEKKIEPEPEDSEQHELPRTTSSFTMSEEAFRAAKNAAVGSPESFWTHTLYRGPEQDGVRPKVKVHYCRSKHTTEQTIQKYFMDKKVLGFDIEWQPDAHKNAGIKKNVSLIQFATEDRIGLFHVALYPKEDVNDLVAPSIRTIMEDASVTKVGVAIKADCTRVRKFLNIDSRGIFELSHLYKLVKFSSSKDFKLINKRLVSLSTQVQDHLHLPLFKGGDVRGSDWSQALGMDQIVYAASDSYAGLCLYDALEIKRKELNPVPPRPYDVEHGKPIRLAEGIEIQTDEELAPEETEYEKRAYSNRQTRFYDNVSVEVDQLDANFSVYTSPPTTPAATTRSKFSKSPAAPMSPLVIAAAELAGSYRAAHPGNRATASGLRCYYLWYHNPNLSLPDIAGLLREIPLQITTVVNYILESIRTEKLPYEKARVREILAELPEEVVKGRYRVLCQACDAHGAGRSFI